MIKKSKNIKIIDETSNSKEDEVITISKAKYLYDYTLEIEFDNGVIQKVDFAPFLTSSPHLEVKKYLNVFLFRKFTLENGQLYWNDYDLIFPIGDLYTNDIKPYLQPISPFEKSLQTLIKDLAEMLKEDSSVSFGDLLPKESNISSDDFFKNPVRSFLEELVSVNRKSKTTAHN
ncbi:MAG: DUF2442 domain-containing protein [Chitinophagales bacterium]